ncbi:hypothetical protein ACLCDV_13850 [Sphingobacterium sp. Lzh-3]|uniref:hypothetical protein n=1 Tax=unclassified Sphingobacterium TaxID=2609468 RepID=UPI00295332B7|nr:hypothetical protein [Sphingobacterium sp. UGAL515B_05]WON93540.1 hypothetical protein OK025_20115 [Sphingobacterium sp. UGAL515B_05]
MENKAKYYQIFVEDKGKQNEVDLGERLGFNEAETMKIIAQLLFENRIEYIMDRCCNYRPTKRGGERRASANIY